MTSNAEIRTLHSVHVRKGFRPRCSAPIFLLPGVLLLLNVAGLPGQEKQSSPVFKSAKPKEDLPKVFPSDPLYQIWQTFQLSRQAAAGDMVAQYELGVRYFLGVGVEADTVQAANWTRKSAEKNYTPAKFNMAILTYHGWGVPWSPFESFRYAQSCAEKGMADAEYFLSILYLENLVVPADYDKALAWLKKAAEAGYGPAKQLLPRVEEIRRQSVQTREGAADSSAQGGALAAHNPISLTQPFAPVAVDFDADTTDRTGKGTLLANVLQSATPEMRQALGLSRLLDSQVKPDSSTLSAIDSAANAGSPEALALLGRIYERGIDVPRDEIRAASYYIRAIRMDSPRAGELLLEILRHESFFGELKVRAARRDVTALFVWPGLLAIGFEGSLLRAGSLITPQQALGFLEDASGAGDVPATIELGLCYYAPRWVGRDVTKAKSLWSQAARNGNTEAMVRLTVARIRENGQELGNAIALLERAVSEGSVLAEVALGYCSETGKGLPESIPAAVRHYRSAASRGSQDAFRALRRLHDDIRPSDGLFAMPE